MADRKITKGWRGKARRIIKQRYKQALAEIGMNARRVRAYINKAYQSYAGTDARMKYPYRVWREELTAVMEQHKLRETQLNLFDLDAVLG